MASAPKNVEEKSEYFGYHSPEFETQAAAKVPAAKRKIFVATINTVAVLTETLYALMYDHLGEMKADLWIPDEIHIICTKYPLNTLATEICVASGPLHTLFSKPVPPVKIFIPHKTNPATIIELTWSDDGTALSLPTEDDMLEDVSEPEQADKMNRCIQRVLARAIDEGNKNEVHLSIAGGRKTMSAHAMAVFQLFGRPIDVVSHTLISPAIFENTQVIFWHPKHGVKLRPNATIQACPVATEAKITLVDIPFATHEYGEKASISRTKSIQFEEIKAQSAHIRSLFNEGKFKLAIEDGHGQISFGKHKKKKLKPMGWVLLRLLADNNGNPVSPQSLSMDDIKKANEWLAEVGGHEENQKNTIQWNRIYCAVYDYASQIQNRPTLGLSPLQKAIEDIVLEITEDAGTIGITVHGELQALSKPGPSAQLYKLTQDRLDNLKGLFNSLGSLNPTPPSNLLYSNEFEKFAERALRGWLREQVFQAGGTLKADLGDYMVKQLIETSQVTGGNERKVYKLMFECEVESEI